MFIENNNLNYEANVMLRGTDIDFRTSMKRQRAGLGLVSVTLHCISTTTPSCEQTW